MIDVSELMTDGDFTKCFTVKRPAVTIAVDGSLSTSYTEFEVIGIVQPAKPSEILSMPEGLRIDDLISVWSLTPIHGSDGNKTGSDILLIGGAPWRVIKEEDRRDNGYTRVFATGYIP